MNEIVSFEVIDDGGTFEHGSGYDAIVDQLDETLDLWHCGELTRPKYIAALKAILERHPHFIDGHAHLGYALMEEGRPKLALQSCLRGFEVGRAAIPPEYAGVIEWDLLENRPFLRAAHGVVLCHMRLGQRSQAIDVMERMITWNPNDNQGIRFLIGSEYLRAGKTAKALTILNEQADQYPPYHYELGLLHFMKGATVAAATSLRRGFVANPYIAEMLCGCPDPMPLAIWHGSSDAEPETAHDYVQAYGDLWYKTPNAIAFVRWLHTHPRVMAERAAIFDPKEALLWEHEFERRRVLIEQEDKALAKIDERLSDAIVVERADRDGRMVAPWLYIKKQGRFSL